MEILLGYGLGKNLQRIVERLWEGHTVITRAGGCHGNPINTGQGVTQGEPVYPTIFNIVVCVLVWAMLLEVCASQEAQHGLRWAAGEQEILFYADDGRITGRNPIWIQGMLTKILRIFERMGLYTNVGNTKCMKCMPGFIWSKIGK